MTFLYIYTITKFGINIRGMTDKTILRFIITHIPNNAHVVGRIKQDLKFLNNSAEIKNVMEKTNLIVSRFQRSANVGFS